MLTNPEYQRLKEIMRYGGIHHGIIIDIEDPLKRGRVRLQCGKFNTKSIMFETTWAYPILPFAGVKDSGHWTVPPLYAMVAFYFDECDVNKPYYFVGGIPTYAETANNLTPDTGEYAPRDFQDNYPHLDVYRTVSGSTIKINNKPLREEITITSPSGAGLRISSPLYEGTKRSNRNSLRKSESEILWDDITSGVDIELFDQARSQYIKLHSEANQNGYLEIKADRFKLMMPKANFVFDKDGNMTIEAKSSVERYKASSKMETGSYEEKIRGPHSSLVQGKKSDLVGSRESITRENQSEITASDVIKIVPDGQKVQFQVGTGIAGYIKLDTNGFILGDQTGTTFQFSGTAEGLKLQAVQGVPAAKLLVKPESIELGKGRYPIATVNDPNIYVPTMNGPQKILEFAPIQTTKG